MKTEGTLLLAQMDHLTGEDVGWAIAALDLPGVRNRSIIPTLTKKGRMGHLLLIDVEQEAESDIGRFLLRNLATYGYHKIKTEHVHHATVVRQAEVIIKWKGKKLTAAVRLKRDAQSESGPFFIESDDILSLHRRITAELDLQISPMQLRRRIETLAEGDPGDCLHLDL